MKRRVRAALAVGLFFTLAVGCQSQAPPRLDPFMGQTTVPPPGTGSAAVRPGTAVAPPYGPPTNCPAPGFNPNNPASFSGVPGAYNSAAPGMAPPIGGQPVLPPGSPPYYPPQMSGGSSFQPSIGPTPSTYTPPNAVSPPSTLAPANPSAMGYPSTGQPNAAANPRPSIYTPQSGAQPAVAPPGSSQPMYAPSPSSGTNAPYYPPPTPSGGSLVPRGAPYGGPSPQPSPAVAPTSNGSFTQSSNVRDASAPASYDPSVPASTGALASAGASPSLVRILEPGAGPATAGSQFVSWTAVPAASAADAAAPSAAGTSLLAERTRIVETLPNGSAVVGSSRGVATSTPAVDIMDLPQPTR